MKYIILALIVISSVDLLSQCNNFSIPRVKMDEFLKVQVIESRRFTFLDLVINMNIRLQGEEFTWWCDLKDHFNEDNPTTMMILFEDESVDELELNFNDYRGNYWDGSDHIFNMTAIIPRDLMDKMTIYKAKKVRLYYSDNSHRDIKMKKSRSKYVQKIFSCYMNTVNEQRINK